MKPETACLRRFARTAARPNGHVFLLLRRQALSPLILHALDPHSFSSGARQEVDADSEAEPGDTRTHEKGCDPDQCFQPAPPANVRRRPIRRAEITAATCG
jgi:hypothetical protein